MEKYITHVYKYTNQQRTKLKAKGDTCRSIVMFASILNIGLYWFTWFGIGLCLITCMSTCWILLRLFHVAEIQQFTTWAKYDRLSYMYSLVHQCSPKVFGDLMMVICVLTLYQRQLK